MAAYSPPATPQIDPDIREDLLRHLDQEIQATQLNMMKCKEGYSMKGDEPPYMTL